MMQEVLIPAPQADARTLLPLARSRIALARRIAGLVALACIACATHGNPAPGSTSSAERPPAEAAQTDLASAVRSAILASKLDSASIGYSIIDCHDEIVLAAGNPSLPLIPASNLKALTTAAALDLLGEGFSFDTRLVLTRLNGRTTLTLVGSGDPALFDPEVTGWSGPRGNWTTVGAAIDAWAAALKAAGVHRVDEFVIDARMFDTEPIPAGDQKWLANRDAGTYAVGVWGFNLGANAATVTVRSGAGGRPAIASSNPPFPFSVSRTSATINTRQRETFAITYGDLPGTLEFRGNLRRNSAEYAVAVHQPLPLSAQMFASEFSRRNITVTAWRVASPLDPGATGETVAPVLSTPIQCVLYGANTHSKNLYAEALLKRVGAARLNAADASIGPRWKPGSWASGHDAMTEWLTRRLSTECKGGLCLADGSGLSDRNQVTADLMARLLASMSADPVHARTYLSSFARPGDEGTLEKRFDKVELSGMGVFAKSGYINGVSCLTGVVVSPDGGATAWSILCNNVGGKVREAKELQEKIVASIAEQLARRTPSRPSTTASAGP